MLAYPQPHRYPNPAPWARFRPGEHLIARRMLYQHHAIYAGDGHVIEFGGGLGGGPVACIAWEFFAKCDRVERVEHSVRFDLPTTLDRAITQLGRCDFDLFSRNCEHFATWCATGLWQSRQVDAVKSLAFVLIAVPAIASIADTSRRVANP